MTPLNLRNADPSLLLRVEELTPDHIEREGLWNFNFKDLADVEEYLQLSNVYAIQYMSGSICVHGFVAFPKAHSPASKLPLILFNRGGNNFGNCESFPYPPRKLGRLTYSDAIFALGRIASMGYCVAASQYRGCYDDEQQDDFGGEDLLDIVHLREMLSSLPTIDTNRTGIIGYSRGGMMALLLAAKYDWVRTVVTVGALTDTVSWFGQQKPIEWSEARSPLCQAQHLRARAPILLMHGKNDAVVPCKQATDFSDRLSQLCIPHEIKLFSGGSHYLAEDDASVADKLQSWLSKNL